MGILCDLCDVLPGLETVPVQSPHRKWCWCQGDQYTSQPSKATLRLVETIPTGAVLLVLKSRPVPSLLLFCLNFFSYSVMLACFFFRACLLPDVTLQLQLSPHEQGMIQSNNKHANTCVVSNDESVSTCKAMAFFMDRWATVIRFRMLC